MQCYRAGWFGAILAALLLGVPGVVYAEEKMPWTLRDHYTFEGPQTTFFFDVGSGEWKLNVKSLGDVIRDAKAEIVLGDGKTIRLSDLKVARDDREYFSGALGDGTFYRSIFESADGLEIRAAIAQFKERPFLGVYLDVKNLGENPVNIHAIRPAVIGPGGVTGISDQLRVTKVSTAQVSNVALFHDRQDASLFKFELLNAGVTFGIGVLQSGTMQSRVNLLPSGADWQGAVECVFTPPITLAPGKMLSADPLWVSHSVSDPHEVQQFFVWAQAQQRKTGRGIIAPNAWVTVPSDAPATDLYAAARTWKDSNVRFAVAPLSWEGRPGSLDGATPNYPSDMKTFVKEVKAAGMQAGVSIDPLRIDKGDGDWSALSDDGTRWLNPTSEKARDAGIKHLRPAGEMGGIAHYRGTIDDPGRSATSL